MEAGKLMQEEGLRLKTKLFRILTNGSREEKEESERSGRKIRSGW